MRHRRQGHATSEPGQQAPNVLEWWPPAIAIVLIVLAVNVVGDGLHDLVKRRLAGRRTTEDS